MSKPNKTVLSFKFKSPMGLRFTGEFGNFAPRMVTKLKAVPNFGNVSVQDYDFDEVFRIELPDETVRPLPPHIESGSEESVKDAYKLRQSAKAAEVHELNNIVRDELYFYAEEGYVEIVGDSFLDKPKAEVKAPEPPPAPKAPAPKKEVKASA